MVDTSTSPAAEPSTGDELTFTPAELNTLISRACAETVAARLRERAAWHRQQADRGRGSGDGLTRACAAFLAVEADMLEAAANRELATTAVGGEDR